MDGWNEPLCNNEEARFPWVLFRPKMFPLLLPPVLKIAFFLAFKDRRKKEKKKHFLLFFLRCRRLTISMQNCETCFGCFLPSGRANSLWNMSHKKRLKVLEKLFHVLEMFKTLGCCCCCCNVVEPYQVGDTLQYFAEVSTKWGFFSWSKKIELHKEINFDPIDLWCLWAWKGNSWDQEPRWAGERKSRYFLFSLNSSM